MSEDVVAVSEAVNGVKGSARKSIARVRRQVDARNVEGSAAPHLKAERLAEEIIRERTRRNEVSAPNASREERLVAIAHRRIG